MQTELVDQIERSITKVMIINKIPNANEKIYINVEVVERTEQFLFLYTKRRMGSVIRKLILNSFEIFAWTYKTICECSNAICFLIPFESSMENNGFQNVVWPENVASVFDVSCGKSRSIQFNGGTTNNTKKVKVE